MTPRHLRFLLRWGVYYNLELVWLNWLLPRKLPAGATLSPDADARRRQAHAELAEATEDAGKRVCLSCEGCCVERVNRFTPFDAIVRANTAAPVRSHDRRIFSLPWMLWNAVGHTFRRCLPAKMQRPLAQCAHVCSTGCTLPRSERPMLCVSWFCLKYMGALTPEEMERSEAPLRAVEELHQEALRAARHPEKVREMAGRR